MTAGRAKGCEKMDLVFRCYAICIRKEIAIRDNDAHKETENFLHGWLDLWWAPQRNLKAFEKAGPAR